MNFLFHVQSLFAHTNINFLINDLIDDDLTPEGDLGHNHTHESIIIR